MTTTAEDPAAVDPAPPVMMINIKTCTAQELASSLMTHRASSGGDGGDNGAHQLLKDTIEILQDKQGKQQQLLSTSKSTETAAFSPASATSAVDPTNITIDLGTELLEEPFEASFMSPRLGKFNVQLYEDGLKATKTNDPTVQIVLPSKSSTSSSSNDDGDDDDNNARVSHIIVFPKPEDCKTLVKSGGSDVHKTTGNLVVLRLDRSITIPKNKNKVQQLCFALPSEKKIGPTSPKLTMDAAKIISSSSSSRSSASNNSNNDSTSSWCSLLCHALTTTTSATTCDHKISVAHVQPGPSSSTTKVFTSYQPSNTSTTSGGMPFVTCYHGVNDGVLYPLREGLLFFKPPRFIPRNELHSISCGRGGGGGSSSRYVDMNVTLNTSKGSGDDNVGSGKKSSNIDSTTVEFTNIQREENPGLNAYIHNVLIPAMQQDAEEEAAAAKKKKVKKEGKSAVNEALTKSVTNEDTSTEDEDEDDDDDGDEDEDEENDCEVIEADVAEEDSNDDDDDDDDEDFDSEEDDDDDDDDMSGSDNDDDGEEGYAMVVQDDFAKSLVKKKQQEESGDGSATESEDDSDEPRKSKRLRQG